MRLDRQLLDLYPKGCPLGGLGPDQISICLLLRALGLCPVHAHGQPC